MKEKEADVPERHDTFEEETAEEMQYEDTAGHNNPAGRSHDEEVPAKRPGDQLNPSEQK